MTNNTQQNQQTEVKIPIITIMLIMVCVAAFVYPIYIRNEGIFIRYYKNNAAILEGKEYYRLLTCTLLHGGFTHIASNMYFLWAYARTTEKFMGHTKQLIMFLLSGLMGSLGSLAFTASDSVGASGICFGVLGSLMALSYSMTESSKAYIKSSVVQLIVLNLIVGFTSNYIDNAAHIFGFIGGYFITMFLGAKDYPHPKRIFGIIMYIIITAFLVCVSYGIIKFDPMAIILRFIG